MTQKYAFRSCTCIGCGLDFSGRFPSGRQYCSLECYRNGKRPNRLKGASVPCKQCGVDVYRVDATGDVFCGKPCHDAHQSRNKISRVCKTCGVQFKWSASRLNQHDPKYCSLPCRTACADWKLNAVIAGNLKQQNSKAPTRLEVAGSALLDQIGMPYQQQVLIAGKFTVDAVLHEKMIVIQWDGNYWHGYRAANDNTPLQTRQAKRSALDKSQDAYMAKCGYVVLRFWEHEVFNQPEKVLEAITIAIRQSAA